MTFDNVDGEKKRVRVIQNEFDAIDWQTEKKVSWGQEMNEKE